MNSTNTPMMQQYREAKKKARDCLLLFRLGDFFELFFDDSLIASKILGLTLTNRKGVAMCGFPFHVAEKYIKILLENGNKVAICDQVEKKADGNSSSKLLKRDIVEIITPGTISNSSYLSERDNNYILCIHTHNQKIYAAWMDASVGELFFQVKDCSAHSLLLIVSKVTPKEILITEKNAQEHWYKEFLAQYQQILTTHCEDWHFSVSEGNRIVLEATNTASLTGFGLTKDNEQCLAPAGALMNYIEHNIPSLSSHVTSIRMCSDDDVLEIDFNVIYNLELFSTMRDANVKYSLFGAIDNCNTVMGSRFLKTNLAAPSRNEKLLKRRYAAVEFFINNEECVQELETLLDGMFDIMRLLTRLVANKAHAKDVYSIGLSLKSACALYHILKEKFDNVLFEEFFSSLNIAVVETCFSNILQALCENPPTNFGEEPVIKTGYNTELDSLRAMSENEKHILNEYVQKEQQKVRHILKLRYNNASGYYFDFSQNVRNTLPQHFMLRQTLKNTDRYKTDELIEIESKIMHAKESLVHHESLLFNKLCADILQYKNCIYDIAHKIANIDMLLSFAKTAVNNNYVQPNLVDETILDIEDGRHAVVENILPQGEFIPNDLHLDNSLSMMMITGPNMAGKSTFLRQNALTVILAHIGSFVPAKSVRLSVFDKIFCRVGASDNMSKGESTFLLEMSETAYILNNATKSSLVIMDEIGRGTSVVDGMAIARAVAEYLLNKNIYTLFATHYHGITNLETKYTNIKNFAMSAKKNNNGNLIFMHKIQEGIAEKSYGIEVAQLAGLPQEVISHAYKCLDEHLDNQMLEKKEARTSSVESKNNTVSTTPLFVDEQNAQILEQSAAYQKIQAKLSTIDINDITPLESLRILSDIIKDVSKN